MSTVKLTRKQAVALGIKQITGGKDGPALRRFAESAKGRAVAATAHFRAAFLAACRSWDLEIPFPEHQFAPDRRWRFDWAWVSSKVALEVQGGLWTQGRHVRGKALMAEYEKLNEAAILGWRVLYCTPQDVETGSIFPLLRRALGGKA